MLAGEAVIVVVWLERPRWPARRSPSGRPASRSALDMGFVMRSQQLRIDAQAREHEIRERQAVLEERHRIGREVHDLVAHSLSVTMLHLTAARREVEDAAEQGDAADLDDAVAALRDAERVGRQAMADIRGTVGLLGQEDEPGRDRADAGPRGRPGSGRGLPWRRARRRVRRPRRPRAGAGHHGAGPLPHRPGVARQRRQARAGLPRRRCASTWPATRASWSSPATCPRGARRNAGGSGLSGMAERAAQLGARFSAGPADRSWVVRVELPRGDLATDGHVCPLPRLTAPFRRTVPGRRRERVRRRGLVRVLLVDDQELVRSGLRRILRRRDGLVVVGECEDGDQVPAAVAEHRPDVVVMDLRMRRTNGIDATRALRQ